MSLGPLDLWTLGPLPSSSTSSYFLLTLEIEIDYWRLTFDLYIDVEKLGVVGGVLRL